MAADNLHALTIVLASFLLVAAAPPDAGAEETGAEGGPPVPTATSDVAAAAPVLREWWDNSPWRFNASIYGWLPKAPVRIKVASITTSLPEKFDNILDSLEMMAMTNFEVHKGRIGLFVSPLFYKGRDDETFSLGPVDRKVTLRETVWLIDFGASYVLGPWDLSDKVSLAVEPYGGYRFFNDNLNLKLHPGAILPGFTFRDTLRFFTPLVGVRTYWDIGDRWIFELTADRGGWDVDHVKKTYQWYALLAYKFKWGGVSSRVYAGYRELHVHYQKNVDLKVWIRGPLVGIGFEF